MGMAERLAALAQVAKPLPDLGPLPMSAQTELHVDGDYAAYYFSGKEGTSFADSKENFLNFVRGIQQSCGVGGRTIIHLSHASTDKGKRHKIATVLDYQANRTGSEKPHNWHLLRQWLEAGCNPAWGKKLWYDREADDGVAAAAAYAHSMGRVPVISSRDKDFRMFAGLHSDWVTGERVLVKPGDFEVMSTDGETLYGLKWFWMQMLTGDSADHIPGLQKVISKSGKPVNCGPKTAENILAGTSDSNHCYYLVAHEYEKYYKDTWRERFVEQAALLWMRPDFTAEVDSFLSIIPKAEHKLYAEAKRLKERVCG